MEFRNGNIFFDEHEQELFKCKSPLPVSVFTLMDLELITVKGSEELERTVASTSDLTLTEMGVIGSLHKAQLQRSMIIKEISNHFEAQAEQVPGSL